MALVMIGLSVLATSDAWKDICSIAWNDEESSHIFLVPIVVAWLVWVRRGRFRHCKPRGTMIGPIMMILGWAAYSLGDSYFVQVAWHSGAVLLSIGALFSVIGSEILFAFLPAVVVLGFVVPVPGRVRQAIALPLEGVTTQVTQQVCELIGMELTRSGNELTINGNQVEIAEACNGLRMVFALTLVSFAFGFGTPLRWYVRLIILAASPISAICCNVVRLVPTVYVYGYCSATMGDLVHSVGGWIMLPISFLLLMGIIKVFRWALVPVTTFTLVYD
jgi:exosortase